MKRYVLLLVKLTNTTTLHGVHLSLKGCCVDVTLLTLLMQLTLSDGSYPESGCQFSWTVDFICFIRFCRCWISLFPSNRLLWRRWVLLNTGSIEFFFRGWHSWCHWLPWCDLQFLPDWCFLLGTDIRFEEPCGIERKDSHLIKGCNQQCLLLWCVVTRDRLITIDWLWFLYMCI